MKWNKHFTFKGMGRLSGTCCGMATLQNWVQSTRSLVEIHNKWILSSKSESTEKMRAPIVLSKFIIFQAKWFLAFYYLNCNLYFFYPPSSGITELHPVLGPLEQWRDTYTWLLYFTHLLAVKYKQQLRYNVEIIPLTISNKLIG